MAETEAGTNGLVVCSNPPNPPSTATTVAPTTMEMALLGRMRSLEEHVLTLGQLLTATTSKQQPDELPQIARVNVALSLLGMYRQTMVPNFENGDADLAHFSVGPLMETERAMLQSCHDFLYDVFELRPNRSSNRVELHREP